MVSTSTAIDISSRARALGIQTKFKDLRGGRVAILPQRVAVIGQGASEAVYPTTKQQVTSAAQAGSIYGYGSPVHLAVKALLPPSGDGVGTIPVTVYPLEDNPSDSSAATGSLDVTIESVTTAAIFRVILGGVRGESFVLRPGMPIAEARAAIANSINATLDSPASALVGVAGVELTAKWKGDSSNQITLTIEGPTFGAPVFSIVGFTGGLLNPTVNGALSAMGNVWETMVLNCLDTKDHEALNAYQEWGETRWGALVHKPLLVFTGDTSATTGEVLNNISSDEVTPNGRPLDRINVALTAPGSVNLDFVMAARELAYIVKTANENPPCDYGSLQVAGITPGPDADQWLFTERDMALKLGISTSEVRDGVIVLQDTVTMYHPEGEVDPGYRYVCDIVKLQNIIHNINLIFNVPDWDGAPLIPDDQPTTNPLAKRPKDAVTAICSKLDNLALEAIISDVDFSKTNTRAQINDQNPKRLDIVIPVALSGNTNQIAIDLEFGFFYGTSTILGG